jgi:hypothetical protein
VAVVVVAPADVWAGADGVVAAVVFDLSLPPEPLATTNATMSATTAPAMMAMRPRGVIVPTA